MNADVEKAMERFEGLAIDHAPDGWPAVRMRDLTLAAQALRDQEAEIAGLRADLSDADEKAALRSRERTEAVMRAEKAEALLRDASRYLDPRHYSQIIRRITAHLGAEQ